MSKIVVLLIRLYQLAISSLLPYNHCRFYPSCSSYAIEAIKTYGVFIGLWLTIKRISKCNPYSKHWGYDPVPQFIEKNK